MTQEDIYEAQNIKSIRLKDQVGDPANADADRIRVYSKSGELYYKDDAGNVTGPIWAGTVGARVFNDTDITTSSGVPEVLAFNSEQYDTSGIYDPGDPELLTVPMDGKYYINLCVHWEAAAGGTRLVGIILNGGGAIAVYEYAEVAEAGYDGVVALDTIYDLSEGDYLIAIVVQNSGGDVDILASSAYSPYFMIQRIG